MQTYLKYSIGADRGYFDTWTLSDGVLIALLVYYTRAHLTLVGLIPNIPDEVVAERTKTRLLQDGDLMSTKQRTIYTL